MMARSHVPFAMTWWWLYCLGTGQAVVGLGTLLAGIGGLLPNLDHPKSVLGRKLWFISYPLSAVVGHRGITHSLLATVFMVITLILVTALPEYNAYRWAIAPLCVGYLSHIAGDMLTPSGVPLFYPKKKKYSLNIFRTGDWKETVVVGCIGLVVFIAGDISGQMLWFAAPFFDAMRGVQFPLNSR
ncbi:MAG: metal-dependent hydrolase [Cyanobacteria bacterium J06643_5]